MFSTSERLATLCVRDVMADDVVTVSANSTMSEAADTLREYGVTGAPVVDELGHCVGMLSGTDFINDSAEHLEKPSAITHVLSALCPTGVYCIEDVATDLVRRHMAPSVQTVDKNWSIIRAGRCMCQEHIHRLVVVDKVNKPIGVISSLDLVSALVNAFEE